MTQSITEDGVLHSSVPLIVGVGASLGELDAFRAFISGMPPDTGMAFVFIQHLSPDYDSKLAELLDSYTQMPVITAESGMAVEANHIYVIPSNATLTIANAHYVARENGFERGARRVMERYSPAHVVIDQQHRILSFSGQTGKVLEPSPGALPH